MSIENYIFYSFKNLHIVRLISILKPQQVLFKKCEKTCNVTSSINYRIYTSTYIIIGYLCTPAILCNDFTLKSKLTYFYAIVGVHNIKHIMYIRQGRSIVLELLQPQVQNTNKTANTNYLKCISL